MIDDSRFAEMREDAKKVRLFWQKLHPEVLDANCTRELRESILKSTNIIIDLVDALEIMQAALRDAQQHGRDSRRPDLPRHHSVP